MRAARAIVTSALVAACGGGPGGDAPDAPAMDAPRSDADAAAPACATALLYNDCDPALNANCATIGDPLRSDDAAAALGIGVRYGGNHDQAAFRALFDAGGFDVIVFESSAFDVDGETASRLAAWIAGGGRIVLSFWDLDGTSDASPPDPSANAGVAATLRAALEVTVLASFTTPSSVHDAPAAPVSLFAGTEAIPTPMNFSNVGLDDGDQLAPSGVGAVVARFGSTAGPGAAVITRNGAAIVLGFLPIELVYQVVRDADSDGTPDAEELYTNALAALCGSA